MALETHFLPISSQDYFFVENNTNNNNMNNNNMLFNNVQIQDVYLPEFQKVQYMMQMKGRKTCMNEGNLGISQPSKKQKLVNYIPSTTASTITSESDDYLGMNLKGFYEQVEKQGNYEIDGLINLQNERLKLALHQQRKQQLGLIIKRLEGKAQQLLKQKDDEILQANKKSIELQEIVRKLEIENQSWQRIATQNHEMIFSLNNKLLQLQQQQQQQQACSSSSSCSNDVNNDAESWCKRSNFDDDGFQTKTGLCKVCNSRNACVLLLPCRHLCSCKDCDALLHACRLCNTPKKASIHAIIQ